MAAPGAGARAAHVLAGLAMAALGAGLLVFVREHPYWADTSAGPAFLPTWVGGLLLLSSLGYVVQVLRGREALGGEDLPDRPVVLRIAAVVTSLAIAAVLLPVAGFRVTSAVLLFVLFSLQGRLDLRDILLRLVLSVGLAVSLHAMFAGWLKVQLPAGIW